MACNKQTAISENAQQPPVEKKVNVYALSGLLVGVNSLFGSPLLLAFGLFLAGRTPLFRTLIYPTMLCVALPVTGIVFSIIGLTKFKKYNSLNAHAIAGLIVSVLMFLLWGSFMISMIMDLGIYV